jgi:hypothetical protein
LDKAELYGGKLVAALDRQHPRDIYDVKILFENEGITDDMRTAFVIYLAGHNRPIHEVLNPQPKDIQSAFENDFVGMTAKETTIDELMKIRTELFHMFPDILNDNERQFLLSIKKGQPEWDLFPVKELDKLPAIQWKLKNIEKLDQKKHTQQLDKLRRVLEQ